MKGYVYAGVSVAIVIIGIFLIYQLGSKQETLQNKDELQRLQETLQNNVEIQNIQVQPATIKVGDTFTVSATLVNNSTVPIVLEGGTCVPVIKPVPFFAVLFDDHATIKAKYMTCAGVGISKILNPRKNITGTSPDSTLAYIATESGTANVTVTFSYSVINQTDPTQPNIEQTISKSFLFTISNQSAKQTTEMNELYKPTLSDDQVAQIITSDLSKHLPTFTKVIIEGRDPIPNNPDYPKHPLRLWYVAPNGTQFYVNSTYYSISGKCAPENSYCGIHDPSGFKITSGRLVYYVDLLWYAKDNLNGPAQYAVDAHNGDVLYSTLLENMTPQDIKNKYVP